MLQSNFQPKHHSERVLRGLCAPGDEVRAIPASDDLIKALQKVLVETEEASDVIMLAISRLSYEQLQVVQVQPLLSTSTVHHT